MKKILFAIILLLLILLSMYLYNIKKSIIDIPIASFTPFVENNNLKAVSSSFKLDNNLPKIEGASAFYPFAANLVQTIYDKDSYREGLVKMVSTQEVFQDLINGSTDISIVTYPSEEQEKMIEESGVELEYISLFIEPLAIIVNKNNPINNISIEQLKRIYYEDELNWNEFVNYNKKIYTYQLEKNNGSQTCFENIVKNNALGKNHKEIKLMPKIIDEIGKDKNGIAYCFYSYYMKMHSNLNTKIVNINNENINSENYPLLFDVYLIYRTDNKNDNIQKIVEWVKSEEGKEIINKIK